MLWEGENQSLNPQIVTNNPRKTEAILVVPSTALFNQRQVKKEDDEQDCHSWTMIKHSK